MQTDLIDRIKAIVSGPGPSPGQNKWRQYKEPLELRLTAPRVVIIIFLFTKNDSSWLRMYLHNMQIKLVNWWCNYRVTLKMLFNVCLVCHFIEYCTRCYYSVMQTICKHLPTFVTKINSNSQCIPFDLWLTFHFPDVLALITCRK